MQLTFQDTYLCFICDLGFMCWAIVNFQLVPYANRYVTCQLAHISERNKTMSTDLGSQVSCYIMVKNQWPSRLLHRVGSHVHSDIPEKIAATLLQGKLPRFRCKDFHQSEPKKGKRGQTFYQANKT